VKNKFIQAYMKTAETFAELSHARRLHVGAIIVKDDRIISIGYNGMPAGWDNNCEDEIVRERLLSWLEERNLDLVLTYSSLTVLVWIVPSSFIKAALSVCFIALLIAALKVRSSSKNPESKL